MRAPALVLLGVLGAATGAGCEAPEPPKNAAWARAKASWLGRDPAAHALFRAIDPGTPEGADARRRLAESDVHYRRGVALFELGDPSAVREFNRGKAIAPMDPALYLRLARGYRARQDAIRAAEFYRKYLDGAPDGPAAPQARAELAALTDDELADVFDEPVRLALAPATPATPVAASSRTPWLAAAGVIAVLAAGLLFAWARRGRGHALSVLAQGSPELHPAIAYLVGSLRHELLKHRIGAVGDVVAALGRGTPAPAQIAFLRARLFGGEPLPHAWQGWCAAFERALGYRLDLRRDPGFRAAGRAIRRIAALEPRIARADPSAAVALGEAHAALGRFDRELAALAARLVRTSVDRALVDAVVGEVRSEHLAGSVALDELRVRVPAEHVEVEVFRIDLVLVLKNVVRNAILAVGRAEPPRRVAVDVSVDVEPTGEELVTIAVRDTSPEAISTVALEERRADRGLGIVTAALRRYHGSIDVTEGGDGFRKAVIVRFFRALTEGSLPP